MKDTATPRLWLLNAMDALNPRERLIVRERKLRDRPRTQESPGPGIGVVEKQLRQLEAAAFAKMRKSLEARSKEVHEFLV